jgi:hypothetical protein
MSPSVGFAINCAEALVSVNNDPVMNLQNIECACGIGLTGVL